MFLSAATITNINTQLRAMILRADTVTVTSACQIPGGIIVRYTTDGEDRVSMVHPKAGDRIADLLADAIRWGDYLLMAEVYSGAETTEEAEHALRIWPATAGDNVKPFTQPVANAPSAQDLTNLVARFGGQPRRTRK